MIANIWSVPHQHSRQPRAERWSIGAVAISRLYLSSHGSRFTVQIPPHDLCVVLQIVGRSTLDDEKSTCRLPAGVWSALGTCHLHVHPHALDTQLLIVQIPRQYLTAGVGAASVESEPPLRALRDRALSRTLRVFSAKPHRFDAAMAEQISTLLCRVVENAIREQHYSNRRAQRAAFTTYARRLERVYRYIKRHLNEPQLAIDGIARDAACSPRYLQKMFEPGGQSLREFILHSRLALVHCDLLSSRLSDRPVTQIALSHGFNNASHFTRKYRRHFGITPKLMRFVHLTTKLQPSDVLSFRDVVIKQRDSSS